MKALQCFSSWIEYLAALIASKSLHKGSCSNFRCWKLSFNQRLDRCPLRHKQRVDNDACSSSMITFQIWQDFYLRKENGITRQPGDCLTPSPPHCLYTAWIGIWLDSMEVGTNWQGWRDASHYLQDTIAISPLFYMTLLLSQCVYDYATKWNQGWPSEIGLAKKLCVLVAEHATFCPRFENIGGLWKSSIKFARRKVGWWCWYMRHEFTLALALLDPRQRASALETTGWADFDTVKGRKE